MLVTRLAGARQGWGAPTHAATPFGKEALEAAFASVLIRFVGPSQAAGPYDVCFVHASTTRRSSTPF